jgi:hypothetical protein
VSGSALLPMKTLSVKAMLATGRESACEITSSTALPARVCVWLGSVCVEVWEVVDVWRCGRVKVKVRRC